MEIRCTVCNAQQSKYTCPKCNIRYCSLHCYRQHSAKCTSQFQQEQLVVALKSETLDPEEKAKLKRETIDMLRRNQDALFDIDDKQHFLRQQQQQQQQYIIQQQHEIDSGGDYNVASGNENVATGDDNGGDYYYNTGASLNATHKQHQDETSLSDVEVENLFAKLDLAANRGDQVESILEALPPSMRQDFEKSIRDGRMAVWIKGQLWIPWWRTASSPSPSPNVQPVDPPTATQHAHNQDLTKKVTQLCSKLAPTLPYNVCGVLYAFAYTQRLYNGELGDQELAVEQVEMILRIASVALCGEQGKGGTYCTMEDMVASVLSNTVQAGTNKQHSLSVLEDVICLLQSNDYVLRALFETSQLVQSAKTATNRKNPKLLLLLDKKIFFLRTYCNDLFTNHDLRAQLIVQIEAHRKQLLSNEGEEDVPTNPNASLFLKEGKKKPSNPVVVSHHNSKQSLLIEEIK